MVKSIEVFKKLFPGFSKNPQNSMGNVIYILITKKWTEKNKQYYPKNTNAVLKTNSTDN